MTYSKNFGTYHDRDRSKKRGIDYFYKSGLSQFSYRIDLKTYKVFNLKNITVTTSFIGDNGELYKDNKMIMIGVNWHYSITTQ